MARVHFTEGFKKDEAKIDRILEANSRTRRQLHRSKQSKRSRGTLPGQDTSAEMDGVQSPLSGVVRYLARRMERGRRAPAARAGDDSPAAVAVPAGRRRLRSLPARVAVLTVSLAALFLTAFQSPGSDGATGTWRRMQAAREHIESCVPSPKPQEVHPTITASYPGSGAKLTWKLLRGITGIMTGDDHDHNGWVGKGQAVSIKTHYPALRNENTELLWKDISKRSKRAMVLIRHPMKAIPSYHNFEYEQRNNLPNHSTRAPLEAWEVWRDGNYREQLDNWERLVRHYMDYFGPKDRIVVQFENMSSKDKDVSLAEMRRIGQFLKEGDDRIQLVEESNLPCVWETIVADKRVGYEGKRRHSLRKGGEINYPFKPEQLDDMEAMLRRLSDFWMLKPSMEDYIEMIEDERKEMAKPNDASVNGEVMEERALKARSSLFNEEAQGGQPRNEEQSHQPEQAPLGGANKVEKDSAAVSPPSSTGAQSTQK